MWFCVAVADFQKRLLFKLDAWQYDSRWRVENGLCAGAGNAYSGAARHAHIGVAKAQPVFAAQLMNVEVLFDLYQELGTDLGANSIP